MVVGVACARPPVQTKYSLLGLAMFSVQVALTRTSNFKNILATIVILLRSDAIKENRNTIKNIIVNRDAAFAPVATTYPPRGSSSSAPAPAPLCCHVYFTSIFLENHSDSPYHLEALWFQWKKAVLSPNGHNTS